MRGGTSPSKTLQPALLWCYKIDKCRTTSPPNCTNPRTHSSSKFIRRSAYRIRFSGPVVTTTSAGALFFFPALAWAPAAVTFGGVQQISVGDHPPPRHGTLSRNPRRMQSRCIGIQFCQPGHTSHQVFIKYEQKTAQEREGGHGGGERNDAAAIKTRTERSRHTGGLCGNAERKKT